MRNLRRFIRVGLSANMLLVLVSCGMFVSTGSTNVLAAGEETPKEIIAIQIRRQGFPCKNPQSATSDPVDTKPDEIAWILICEDAKYRVNMVPDMAARVEKLN